MLYTIMRSVKHPARLYVTMLLMISLLTPLALSGRSYAAPIPGNGPGCSKSTFLGLIPWYQYLNVQDVSTNDNGPAGGVCQITNFDDSYKKDNGADTSLSPFLLIGLAIVDDLLRIAAFVAVGYIIYGGFTYMTSNGSSDGTKRGQQTVINALVGLVLAVAAATIVAFIGNKLSTGG